VSTFVQIEIIVLLFHVLTYGFKIIVPGNKLLTFLCVYYEK